VTAGPAILPGDRAAPPVARVRLAAEVVATYVRVRVAMRRSDLPTTIAGLRARPAVDHPDDPRVVALRLSRAALRTLALLPSDTRCLNRSLVVLGLLARRGIDTRLVIAARPQGGFAAHAWVELDGRALFDPAAPPFERLVTL
jgi:hypothetical protein